ncbi:hypothetical protein EG328_004081 [Venturia inaequalis]|uniref:Mitochondrial carrier protein n=1 Tax=Venturia inaequalis TaxID=5025 RepID=A0A8H3YW03_VENIN|nr:hypothetical protein EG328_004081 [Venturia inaequalis]KAE9989424.1 hypothetical protein EG327_002693 [Venturia inaequalis]
MPDSTDNELSRHRRPKPDAFDTKENDTPEKRRARFFKAKRTDFASAASSLTAIFLAFPLDTLKTRLQASAGTTFPAYRISTFNGHSIPSETMACVRYIYKTEGLRGFYRGMMTPLVTASATRILSLHYYQTGKYWMDEELEKRTGESPLTRCNDITKSPNWNTIACFSAAGAFSGAVGTLVACPFELTKIGRQLSTDIVKLQGCRVEPAEQAIRQSYYGKTTWQTMRAIARNRGVFGLYSGFRLHLVRDIIGTSIWFAGYETLKQEISYLRGSPPNNALPVSVASFLSGCLSLLVTAPLDAAKTRFQRNCLMQHRDRTEKVSMEYMSKVAWRGMPINLLRSGMLNLVFFLVFENAKVYINDMD